MTDKTSKNRCYTRWEVHQRNLATQRGVRGVSPFASAIAVVQYFDPSGTTFRVNKMGLVDIFGRGMGCRSEPDA